MKKNYYIYKMNKNVINVYPFILLAICACLYFLIYRDKSIDIFNDNILFVTLLLIPYLLFHELLHSFSYVIHGAKFKNVTYGIVLEKGVMCCLCKQNITKKNILISLLYPFFFIGIVTLIIGIIFDLPILVLLSFTNIVGCSGDLTMFYHLVRIKNFEYSEFDDPTSFGLYTTEDLSSRKFFGLDYVDKKEKLDIKDYRKLYVSKTSVIFLLLYFVICVFDIIIQYL